MAPTDNYQAGASCLAETMTQGAQATAECGHEHVYPPPFLACSLAGCQVSIGVPELLVINNDDDNGNGIADFLDPGPMPEEDDLRGVALSFFGCGTPRGSCVMDSWSIGAQHGPDYVFYTTPDKADNIIYEPLPAPAMLYIEGRRRTDACGERTEFEMIDSDGYAHHDGPATCCREYTDPLRVVKVYKLEWMKGALSNEGLSRCPNNGGLRIFPGKTSPTDPLASTRRKVKLVATVFPRVAGVTVYFRVWDVDDPFDQLHADMPNVQVIDDDDDGMDNRPDGAVWSSYQSSDENGQATVTFTVSMQPGNNYRAAATCLQHVFDYSPYPQVDQADADALSWTYDQQTQTYSRNGDFSGYRVPVVWSKMLTVWRKLWVERDTMAPPDPVDLRVDGLIHAIFPTPGRPGLTTVASLPSGFNDDLNNYEEGEIVFASCPSGNDTFSVVESYPGNVLDGIPHEIVILGTPGACAATGTFFTLYDDDDPSALGTPTSPHFPDGGQLLTSAFQPAYILPVYAGPAYRDVVEFDEYLTATEIDYGIGGWDDERDLTSTGAFWSCFVVGAWEGAHRVSLGPDYDGDPDHCFTLFMPPEEREGAESPTTGATDMPVGVSLVFLQAIRDDAACIEKTDEVHTVVHEIGHTCGDLGHQAGTIMEEAAPKNQNSFNAQQLIILRNQDPW